MKVIDLFLSSHQSLDPPPTPSSSCPCPGPCDPEDPALAILWLHLFPQGEDFVDQGNVPRRVNAPELTGNGKAKPDEDDQRANVKRVWSEGIGLAVVREGP